MRSVFEPGGLTRGERKRERITAMERPLRSSIGVRLAQRIWRASISSKCLV